jgi:hypothetical protein
MELIRFVSSHEVGHTLGLRHNMGASSATPVEKLRDKDYQAKMDTPLLLWIMRVLITCTARRWCNKLSNALEIMTNGLSNGVILISQKQLKKKKES